MEEDWSGCYGFLPWYERFYANMSLLRYGGFAGAMKDILSSFGLELHSRAIAGSAKVSWEVGILHLDYLLPGFMSLLDFKLRCVNEIQASLTEWLEGGRRTLVYSIWKSCVRHGWDISPEEPSESSEPAIVVVWALVLLELVHQYLAGNLNRGGSRAYYSRSSLDFRDIYVAIVLFLGAYVWIKFREAALRGVHEKKLRGGTKVVYDARLTPPICGDKKLARLELGRFATPQEAHNKFLIAAFYYDRGAGLLDGWFQVPPMSKEESSLTGGEKRKWVIRQAKKVYEDFKKERAEAAEAALVQELFEASKVQATPGRDEVNVDFSMASLLNSAEHQQPNLVSQAVNQAMDVAMLGGNHGLEYTSRSLDGIHEGLALSNGYDIGCQEGFALPVSQLPTNTESRMSLNGSDQLNLFQTLVRTLQQQISLQRQRISDQQQRISDQQQQISLYQQLIQEFGAQISRLQNQQGIQQQQLLESMIQNPQWSYQLHLQEQQLQDAGQGVPNFGMEIEQGMHQHNHSGLTTPPPE